MRIQHWLAASMLASMLMNAHADSESNTCTARLAEIDAAIEAARKEGSMRKVATLKDLRTEALRCANKSKPD